MKKRHPLMQSFGMLGFAAVLILLSKYVLKPQFKKQAEEKEKGDLLFRNLQRDGVIEIAIKNDKGPILLKKGGESKTWHVETTKSFSADDSTVDTFISGVLGTKKDSDVSIDSKGAGLDAPKFELKLTYIEAKDKKVDKTLLLGEDSPVDYKSYAKWSDQPGIFMISKSLKMTLDKKSDDFRNKKIFQTKVADLREIKLSGTSDLHLLKSGDADWKIVRGSRLLKSEMSKINDWMSNLSGTRAIGFASDEKTNLAKYGLKKPTATLELTPVKGDKIEWIVGIVKSPKETHDYTTNNQTETIYEVQPTFVDALKKNSDAFRPIRVYTMERTKVAKIHYTTKTTDVTLEKSGDTWKGTFKNGKETQSGKVLKGLPDRIINTFAVLRALKYLDKKPTDPSLGLNTAKVEFSDDKGAKLGEVQVGKEQGKAQEVAVWNASMEDPVVALLDMKGTFPEDAWQVLEKNDLAKATASESSSGSRKVRKLEKTVKNVKDMKKLPKATVEKGVKYSALMTLKNGQKFKIVFDAEKAPYTVSNFIYLARNGFYDNVAFHRVIPDFVVQGGDPTGTGRGGPGWIFDNEDNDLKHVRGALSMAHAGRNTNGSQFFIVLKPQPHLDGVHTVFGHVTEGIDQIDKIKQGDTIATLEVFEEK